MSKKIDVFRVVGCCHTFPATQSPISFPTCIVENGSFVVIWLNFH